MTSLLYPPNGILGAVLQVDVGTLAAGVQPTLTVPAGKLWRVRSWVGTLTTSAVAGVRQPFARAQTGAAVVFARSAQATTVGPGAAASFNWALGLSNPATSIATAGIAGLFDLLLPETRVFAIVTAAFDAGDQWSAVSYSLEEWTVSP